MCLRIRLEVYTSSHTCSPLTPHTLITQPLQQPHSTHATVLWNELTGSGMGVTIYYKVIIIMVVLGNDIAPS